MLTTPDTDRPLLWRLSILDTSLFFGKAILGTSTFAVNLSSRQVVHANTTRKP
jgi:hypothetical protein